jgi:DNA-binding MarR family transcriptional regulator
MHRPTRTLYLFNRANAAVKVQLERLLRPLDITVAQYTCMSRIRGHEVMSSAKLARAHRVSPQTMYETITNLEKRAFLTREKGPENNKQLLVSLTRQGHKILDRCDRKVDRIESLVFAGINTANHALLREFLQIMIENTARAELGEVANDADPFPGSTRGAPEQASSALVTGRGPRLR